MMAKDANQESAPALSDAQEAVLVALVDEVWGGAERGGAVAIDVLSTAAGISERLCWERACELQQLGLLQTYDAGPGKWLSNAASATPAGADAASRLNAVPSLGPAPGFADGLPEESRLVLDAVTEHELRYASGAATRSQLRTIVRSVIQPKPDVEFANLAIAQLVGSHLTAQGGVEPSYQVNLVGLLASRWGTNALQLIEQTLGLLRQLKAESPALSRYSWRALREAAGLPSKSLNLAYLSIVHSKLGLRMHRAEGDYWWVAPPDLDLVLDVDSALDHVRAVLAAARGVVSPLPVQDTAMGAAAAPADPAGVPQAPKVFISYSHDDEPHKRWVLKLATKLREAGVDVVLDQWDLGLGQDLAHFMEQAIAQAKRVVMVCSATYVAKADAGKGGVGYEKMIFTREILSNSTTNQFIPVIRANPKKAIPLSLGTRLYLDFSDDHAFDSRLEELLREIHAAPKNAKPPLGTNPFLAGGVATASHPAQQAAPQSGAVILSLSYEKKPSSTGDTHWYDLVVTVKNTSAKRFDDWQVEIQFPTALLDATDHACKVASRSDKRYTTFLVDGRKDGQSIYPGEVQVSRFGYLVNNEIFWNHDEIFGEAAKVDGEMVARLERCVRDLQRF